MNDIFTTVFCVFLILKVITFSWIWVFSPLWIPAGSIVIVPLFCYVLILMYFLLKQIGEKYV